MIPLLLAYSGSTFSWLSGFCLLFYSACSSAWSSFSVFVWFCCSVFWFPVFLLRRLCAGTHFCAIDDEFLFVAKALRFPGVSLVLLFARFIDLMLIAAHC